MVFGIKNFFRKIGRNSKVLANLFDAKFTKFGHSSDIVNFLEVEIKKLLILKSLLIIYLKDFDSVNDKIKNKYLIEIKSFNKNVKNELDKVNYFGKDLFEKDEDEDLTDKEKVIFNKIVEDFKNATLNENLNIEDLKSNVKIIDDDIDSFNFMKKRFLIL